MSKPVRSTITRKLKELRKLIETHPDPVVMRIAQAAEDGIRWATEDTHRWPSPADNVLALARIVHEELSIEAKRSAK